MITFGIKSSQKSLYNLGLILDMLGFQENDELVLRLREVYPEFIYPPNREQTQYDSTTLEDMVGKLSEKDTILVKRWVESLLKDK